MNGIDESRAFRLWDYSVSHSSLLIRSPKDSANPTNVDLVFVGVEYVRLPVTLGRFSVSTASASDVARELGKSPSHGSAKGYRLQIGERDGFIIAAGFSVSEHDNEHLWSPFR